jgi:predicted nucleotidyltransferase
MKPSERLELHREEARRIVATHHHANLRVFGSVARGEDDKLSDIDFIVDLKPEASGFDFGDVHAELSELLGVPVHLLTEDSIPRKHRERILSDVIAV